MEKPTIAIGDVHGLDLWRDVLEAHPECRIVFLGDYLDPFFYMSKVRLLGNLREIIDFKRSRPEDTVLLLGNHDLHYFCEEASPASRFDAGIAGEASSLFLDNLDLFQYAFQDVPALLRVGSARGGRACDTGGIFWADKSELEEPLHGFTQIVGHNRVEEVTEHIGQGGGKVVFCDCLRNGLYLYI